MVFSAYQVQSIWHVGCTVRQPGKAERKVKFCIFALENQDQHNFKIFLGQTKQNRENQKKQKKQKTQFSGGLVFWENQRDLEKTKKNKGLVDGGGSARSLWICFFVFSKIVEKTQNSCAWGIPGKGPDFLVLFGFLHICFVLILFLYQWW